MKFKTPFFAAPSNFYKSTATPYPVREYSLINKKHLCPSVLL